jgi:hypothetical protein
MENRGLQIWVVLIVIVVVAGGVYWFGNSQFSGEIKTTKIQVGTFYDGKNGYSVSIPNGNTSTCIWNYTDGNAAIPGLETTSVRNASEKHTVYSYTAWDWKVLCVDDFGNYYVGTFPKSK